MGIPFADVIDKLQLSSDNSSVSRIHLLRTQDLRNICRDFNIHAGARLCANDADSVAAWVELQRADGDSCMVRYVKFQGVHDETRSLSANDFMLVIISEAQIAGVQNVYKPGCEVAMDSTHGTNAYDFQLTTLMFVDEHGEGLPGAFCISNRTDESAMSVFLQVCKENFGCDLQQIVLMTERNRHFEHAEQHFRAVQPVGAKIL